MAQPKPMGANPPPRSLRESQALLAAEAYDRTAIEDWKALGALSRLVIGLALLVGCAIGLIWYVAGILLH